MPVCVWGIPFKEVSHNVSISQWPKPQFVFKEWQWLILPWEGNSSVPFHSSLFHCFCLCNLVLIYYITSSLAPMYGKSLNSRGIFQLSVSSLLGNWLTSWHSLGVHKEKAWHTSPMSWLFKPVFWNFRMVIINARWASLSQINLLYKMYWI